MSPLLFWIYATYMSNRNSFFSAGPPFMLIICSDSRVNEQEIFSAKPGTLFTAGNVANRFDETDLNSYVSIHSYYTI